MPTHTILTARLSRCARLSAAALMVALLPALAACGGDDDGPSAPSGTGTLRLSNASEVSAWYVYVKACNASAWGADRLGTSVLSHGESATLSLESGCYDLRALSDPDDDKSFERRALTVAASGTTQVQITDWADGQ